MQHDDVVALLSKIELWLLRHAKPLFSNLNPPASKDGVIDVEKQLDISLPNSVRTAYLCHDGEVPTSDGIFGTWRWLSLSDIVSKTEQMLKLDQKFGFNEFKRGLIIPILESGSGDFLYVESVSNPGNESEVFEWHHERPSRTVSYPNFEKFLASFLSGLERGKYVYLPEEINGLIDSSDL